MSNTPAEGTLYTIGHLVQFSGLTDRTIRNYIASGILHGEKINGVWYFSPEQIGEFLAHPAVRPSILAKHNALVFDFMANRKKKHANTCIILDLPGKNHKKVSEYFCCAINNGVYQDLHFALDAKNDHLRVILTGDTFQILTLVNEFVDQEH